MPIWSFSQTTWTPYILNDSLVVISLPQLKQTNLIFLEHRKFKTLNELLIERVNHLNALNLEHERIDSIRQNQLYTFAQVVQTKNGEIQGLNQTLEKEKKKSKVKTYIIGGAVSVIVLSVLISSLK